MRVKNTVLGGGRPKICTPIVEKTKAEIARAAEEIKTLPTDMVEWRADWFEGLNREEELREGFQLLRRILGEEMPILFTIRTKPEGGQVSPSLSEYKKWNCLALSLEADLVDIELFTAEKEEGTIKAIRKEADRQGKRLILSSHDFSGTPQESQIIDRLCQMQKYGADITKLAVMPQNPADVLTLLSASLKIKEKYADRPFILMSMSSDGLISRLCGETFGSCLTFGCCNQPSAPGQMEVRDLHQILEAVHRSIAPPLSLSYHLFLIGFMGTGKSTIALELSHLLKVPRIEMDQRIVDKEGVAITEIFSRCGEEYFRDLETAMLGELGEESPSVVSCGGGIVLRRENIERMREKGKIILLTASPKTILARIGKDNSRPNLKGRMSEEGIAELMKKREEFYQAAAQITVETDKKTPGEICQEICSRISAFPEKNG